MKRKVVSLIVALIMATSCMLTGCGSGAEKPQPEEASTEEVPEVAELPAEKEVEVGTNTEKIGSTDFDGFVRPRIAEDGKLKVALICTKPDTESLQRDIKQAEIEAEHRGWELSTIVWESDMECRTVILNTINQDVDAILLMTTQNMDAKEDLISQAREKGIGVYCVDNQVINGVISNCTMPNGIAAAQLAYKIGSDMLWNGNISVLTIRSMQVHIERTDIMKSLFGVYSGVSVLDEQDALSGSTSPDQFAFDTTKTWITKYGDEIDGIIASCDDLAKNAAEAIEQSSAMAGEDFWVAGIDGGSGTWDYIRRDTAFKYNYAQPFELFTHNAFEIINQIQVEGLNPGDEGCMIKTAGEVVYSDGIIITRENVPEVGANIHSVFDYYGGDPDDPDAWYNWTDAGGAYVVTGAEQ